ncbi:IS3 family transposase [Shimazuella alba]|uniref:IS3 family transposase n=1 Tax=Shimazuella alba TaxID=2690964 RepID=A0A6I4VVL5_9BACL|nr:IS3 family transposase [Shimazuella alba]
MKHFNRELDRYIHCYNHKRMKIKGKGMSPILIELMLNKGIKFRV